MSGKIIIDEIYETDEKLDKEVFGPLIQNKQDFEVEFILPSSREYVTLNVTYTEDMIDCTIEHSDCDTQELKCPYSYKEFEDLITSIGFEVFN